MDQLDNIINGCLKGDRKSQELLYKMFSTRMFGLCLQYADNQDDAADILQEGFIKVFRKLEQFGGKGSFEGWIRRIMINTALEKYRSQVILQRVDDVRNEIHEASDDGIFSELTSDELVALIQTLSPKYRMVFNLYAIEGYNHKEISEELGISVGTSKSNLSRARAILQAKIKHIYGSAIVR